MKLKYLLLLVLFGCMDHSVNIESTTIVYEYIKVGDMIPETTFEWTQADAEAVLAALPRYSNFGNRHAIRNCFGRNEKHLLECFAARRLVLLLLKDQRIRELQLLGIR